MKPTTVDQYVASLSPEHAAIVKELRGIVKKAAPKATEAYKWAQPVYESDGPIVWMKAYSRYVNIGFWRGAELNDKYGLLQGEGDRMRHVKLTNIKDIKKGAITDYVKQAVKLNAQLGSPTMRKQSK